MDRESSRRDMPSASVGRATQFSFAQPSSRLRSLGDSSGDENGIWTDAPDSAS
jgi:hypothetical protein